MVYIIYNKASNNQTETFTKTLFFLHQMYNKKITQHWESREHFKLQKDLGHWPNLDSMKNKAILLRDSLCLLEAHLYFTHISSPFEELSQLNLIPTISSQFSALTFFAARDLHETHHGRLNIISLGVSQDKGGLYGLAKTVGTISPLKDEVSGVEGVIREKG